MKTKIEQLQTLATNLVGDGEQPNCFFVSHNGTVVMLTTDFNAAFDKYHELLRRGVDCSLEDRRQGVVCSYNQCEGTDKMWEAIDETASGYYAVLRFHGNEAAALWEAEQKGKTI